MIIIQNILGAIGGALNGLTAIILATTYGFGAFPSMMLFLVGGLGMAITGQVSPILLQSELVVLAGSLGKNRNERLTMCALSGVIVALLGATGTVGAVMNFVGDEIMYGIMAGVGIMLTKVSVDMMKGDKKLGISSLVAGVVTYLITYDVIYTTVVSIFVPSILWNIFWKKNEKKQEEQKATENIERLSLTRITFNPAVVRGTLAITTLAIGGVISDSAINASFAGQTVNFNFVSIYTGIATALSSLFGGAPGGIIVSGTASAPNPILSGVIMMAIMALVMILKLIGPIKKILPTASVAGLLFVMGAMVIFPGNAANALVGNPLIGGITMIVAALVDPFAGLCAGVAIRFIVGLG